MPVEFQDYSFNVKAALNDITIAWLYEWSSEIASQAKDKCKLDGDAGEQLRKSYKPIVNENKGEAKIGSPLESAYWEEFGTGEHAADKSKKHREGWWVYTPGNPGPEDYQSGVYASQEEAESMARHIQKKYGIPAVATDGRDPQYTLQNAFKKVAPQAKADLEAQLREGLGE